jgi:hypothetical protein
MTVDPEVQASGEPRRDFASALLVGIVAIVVAWLVVLEVAVSHEGARADSEASRLTVLAATVNDVSQAPMGFQLSKSLEASQLSMEGASRELVSLDSEDAIGHVIGKVEFDALDRMMAIAAEMGAVPDASSPLDPYARDALASTVDDVRDLVAEQNAAIARASASGSRGLAIVLGLSLAALAGVLVGLAAVIGRGTPGLALLVLGYVAAGMAIVLGIVGAGWLTLP